MKFEAEYEVDDGYCGGSRPKHFTINSDDLDSSMDDEQVQSIFDEYMQTDFEQNVCPYGKNRDKFLTWAKERIEEMKKEEAPNA